MQVSLHARPSSLLVYSTHLPSVCTLDALTRRAQPAGCFDALTNLEVAIRPGEDASPHFQLLHELLEKGPPPPTPVIIYDNEGAMHLSRIDVETSDTETGRIYAHKMILDRDTLEIRNKGLKENRGRIKKRLDVVDFEVSNDQHLPKETSERQKLAEAARDAVNGKVHPSLVAKRICDPLGTFPPCLWLRH